MYSFCYQGSACSSFEATIQGYKISKNPFLVTNLKELYLVSAESSVHCVWLPCYCVHDKAVELWKNPQPRCQGIWGEFVETLICLILYS